MFCTNCGKKLADDSKFCPDCGTKISGTTTRKRKSSQETDSSEPKEVIQAEDDSMKEDNKKSKDWKSFFYWAYYEFKNAYYFASKFSWWIYNCLSCYWYFTGNYSSCYRNSYFSSIKIKRTTLYTSYNFVIINCRAGIFYKSGKA